MTAPILPCPICANPLAKEPRDLIDRLAYEYSCPECGTYLLDTGLIEQFQGLLEENSDNRLRLRHALSWLPREEHPPYLNSRWVEEIVHRPLPSLPEQFDNLILWLGKHFKSGVRERIRAEPYQTIIGAETLEGLEMVVGHLMDTGVLEGRDLSTKDGWVVEARLTPAGWQRYTELIHGARKSKRAFMAMGYSDSKVNAFVKDVFKPAVRQTSFELIRLDDDPKAGLIDDRLRVEIRRARFLIVDLTHDNNGAYWEAGFSEGLGKPVIYTCEKTKFDKSKTHFDTNHCHTVLWELDKPDKAAEDLKATIRATLPDEALLEDPKDDSAT